MIKSLKDISWQVTEPEYRADDALSYSTLAKYEREGFYKIDTLFNKVESPSLTFGSAVDALITGGDEEFNNNFFVADFPSIGDSVLKMVRALFNNYSESFSSIDVIPNKLIISLSNDLRYQLNWKPETRAKVIKEQGADYYKLLYLAGNKTILNSETYQQVISAVKALRENETTSFYFAKNDPFDGIVREYQLKFKAAFEGINYRCMADLLITDSKNKIVYPVDLKTSSHEEGEFYKSFIDWCYSIQARLYWRIIRQNMDKDEYFKDFKLADYTFVVVNKKTLTPLAWKFKDTTKEGTLYYGTMNKIMMRDPFDIGKELSSYLQNHPKVPEGIYQNKPNDIVNWLNKM